MSHLISYTLEQIAPWSVVLKADQAMRNYEKTLSTYRYWQVSVLQSSAVHIQR